MACAVKFEAESPDEAALVSAASVYGYHLETRRTNDAVVQINGHPHTYSTLNVLEFDSTRKRMSVVVRLPDGTLRLLCKGADSAITSILGPQSDDVRAVGGEEGGSSHTANRIVSQTQKDRDRQTNKQRKQTHKEEERKKRGETHTHARTHTHTHKHAHTHTHKHVPMASLCSVCSPRR